MPDVTRLQPKDCRSDLDEIAREGARRMLAQALAAERSSPLRLSGTRSWTSSWSRSLLIRRRGTRIR